MLEIRPSPEGRRTTHWYAATSRVLAGYGCRVYFDQVSAAAVTADSLAAVGLPVAPLAELTVDVVRVSPTGKWHVPGSSWHDRCTHLSRTYGYGSGGQDLPVQTLPLLGSFDLCGRCSHRFGPPGAAGVYWRAAGVVQRAAVWVADLEARAAGMDWLAYSRSTASTPFGPPDPVVALLGELKGVRGWAAVRGQVQTVWTRLQQRADTAWQVARQAAGPPGTRARAARARDVVGQDRRTREEAELVEAIAGAHRYRYPTPHTWTAAAQAWLGTVAVTGDPAAGHAAMLAAVEDLYRSLPVRDVSLLPCTSSATGSSFASPAAWAQAEYVVLRRTVVDRWAQRLAAALNESHGDSGEDRLLLVSAWPIVDEQAREIAYLAQYPQVVCGPDLSPRRYRPTRILQAVVLRVPTVAADHATAAARAITEHQIEAGPPFPASQAPDPAAVYALLRRACLFLTEETLDDPHPDTPVPAAVAQRRHLHARRLPDLSGWLAAGGHRHELPLDWTWTPVDPGGIGEGTDLAILERLCTTFRHLAVELLLAAGPYQNTELVTLTAAPDTLDTTAMTLTCRPEQASDGHVLTVPLRRLVSVRSP